MTLACFYKHCKNNTEEYKGINTRVEALNTYFGVGCVRVVSNIHTLPGSRVVPTAFSGYSAMEILCHRSGYVALE